MHTHGRVDGAKNVVTSDECSDALEALTGTQFIKITIRQLLRKNSTLYSIYTHNDVARVLHNTREMGKKKKDEKRKKKCREGQRREKGRRRFVTCRRFVHVCPSSVTARHRFFFSFFYFSLNLSPLIFTYGKIWSSARRLIAARAVINGYIIVYNIARKLD